MTQYLWKNALQIQNIWLKINFHYGPITWNYFTLHSWDLGSNLRLFTFKVCVNQLLFCTKRCIYMGIPVFTTVSGKQISSEY